MKTLGPNSHPKPELLYNPGSIAVIGASATPGKRGYDVIQNLRQIGYRGEIYPVNPKYKELLGLPCYPSIGQVPVPVGAAAICLSNIAAVAALEECGRAGVGAAGIVANGFAEAGPAGVALQNQLVTIAHRYGMVVSGPNCLGVADRSTRVAYWTGLPPVETRSGIGALIQSGALVDAIVGPAQERGLSVDVLATTGNEAIISASDHLDYLVDHDGVQVIVALLEGFKDPQGFVRSAEKALRCGKPVIVLKIGRSEAGRRAAFAHTASLATSDAVLDAVFDRIGVVRVHDIDELLEAMALFVGVKPMPGHRVVVTVVSGAGCGLLADIADQVGLELPAPSATTTAQLKAEMPPITIANPLDIALSGDMPGLYHRCVGILADSHEYDLLAVGLNCSKATDEWGSEFYQDHVRGAVNFALSGAGQAMVFSFNSGAQDPVALSIAKAGNVPVLQGARESLLSVKRLLDYSKRRENWLAEAPSPGRLHAASGPPHRQGGLSERESKAILRPYGLRFVREVPAGTPEAAVAAADSLGYPVAIKVDSPDISHKSDVGGVALDVVDSAAARAAFSQVVESAREHVPNAQIAGVLVQEMAPPGHELILGIKRDEQFGPVILVGLGGIFVELLRDFALAVPPVSRERAYEMIRSLRGYPVLQGARGGERADIDAVVESILALSRLATDQGIYLESVDINPLIVGNTGHGAVAVDALVTLRPVNENAQNSLQEETL